MLLSRLLLRAQAGSQHLTLHRLLGLPPASAPAAVLASLLHPHHHTTELGTVSPASCCERTAHTASSASRPQHRQIQPQQQLGLLWPETDGCSASVREAHHAPVRNADAFQIEQPAGAPASEQSEQLQHQRQHSVPWSAPERLTPERQRAYATARPATGVAMLPSFERTHSASGASSDGQSDLPAITRGQQPEFSFPAKAYYIGVQVFTHVPDTRCVPAVLPLL